jgi:hypothetical protein
VAATSGSGQTALAAAAALVAVAFALSTLDRWLDRRRPHELAWSVALAMFAVGAGALWLGAADGWDGPTFRAFYLFGAILNVPFLALGTIYLLGGRRRGDAAAVGISLGSAFAAGVMVVAPLSGEVPAHRLPQGSEVFGPLPRVLAAVASGAGALVVLGGAAWSAWRFGPGRPARAPGARMAGANAVIAVGTLVLGTSGLLNSVLGAMQAFAVTLVVGITLLFLGFLLASGGPRPAVAKRPPSGET